jgi:hypothetical protein
MIVFALVSAIEEDLRRILQTLTEQSPVDVLGEDVASRALKRLNDDRGSVQLAACDLEMLLPYTDLGDLQAAINRELKGCSDDVARHIPEENAKVRDGVIRAFAEMYRDQQAEFPSAVSEAEYRRRMELSYPIHPELFDRLFNDWSALDKFQRTRGVLRLMALAISQLWLRNDQSLLIMPGNLPMDSGALVSEMKKYLEEGWDPVIKSDVDGENALPLRLDKENKHFGRISATRRAARTVYMGSAAKPDGSRGVDVKRVVLGCVQPASRSASSRTPSSGCRGRPPTCTSTALSTGIRW